MILARHFVLCALGAVLCVTGAANPSPPLLLQSALLDAWQRPDGEKRWRDEARLWFYAGSLAQESRTKKQCFELGKASAESLLRTAPQDAAGLFWFSANLSGQVAQAKNLWALSALGTLEETLVKLAEMHSGFAYGGAHRVLGVIYEAAPGFISIGDSDKAERHLKQALQVAGDFPGNRLAWADWLIKKERFGEARKQLEHLRVHGMDGDWGVFWPERYLWQKDLAKLEKALRQEVH